MKPRWILVAILVIALGAFYVMHIKYLGFPDGHMSDDERLLKRWYPALSGVALIAATAIAALRGRRHRHDRLKSSSQA